MVLLWFLDGKTLEGKTLQPVCSEYNLHCEKTDTCWLNRDYEVLLANILIVFVTAESNYRENGGRETSMLSVLNNGSV